MNKIHPIIKKTLGFDENLSDKEFKKQWKRKSTQVCKPCWELKYCPYGPFVEQSPLLPSTLENATEHNEYLKSCLESNKIGSIVEISDGNYEIQKERLKKSKKNIKILLPKILKEKRDRELIKYGEENDLDIHELYGTPLDNFQNYKVPFSLDKESEKDVEKWYAKFDIDDEIQMLLDKEIERIEQIVKTRKVGDRKELDKSRRKYFEQSVKDFNPENYPESIPNFVSEMECSIFGHICPVVFVGESITESTEERRRGRYIPFKTKIRVVRRDNYTCQECSKHLQDDEVEFDHEIPIAKGGSSEEHNIRLTCYDCNREKSDKYVS